MEFQIVDGDGLEKRVIGGTRTLGLLPKCIRSGGPAKLIQNVSNLIDASLTGDAIEVARDLSTMSWEEKLIFLLFIFPLVQYGGTFFIHNIAPRLTSLIDVQDGRGALLNAIGDFGTTIAKLPNGIASMLERLEISINSFSYWCDTVEIIDNGTVCITKHTHASEGSLTVYSMCGAKEISGVMIALHEATSYTRSQPYIIGEPSYLKARLEKRRLAEPEIAPPSALYLIEDVVIYGDGVITKEAISGPRIVEESLLNIAPKWAIPHLQKVTKRHYVRRTKQSSLVRLPDEPVILLKQAWDNNYGHWLVESLPRIGLVGESFALDSCKVIVSNWQQNMRSVFRDSLELCGITNDRILWTNGDPTSVRHLIYPSPLSEHPWMTSPYIVAFLEKLADQAVKVQGNRATPERVYLSRERFGKRRITNEDEIRELLERSGFITFYPEAMSFASQVAICANAKVICANMGAGLTNLVFAPRGVHVIALASEYMPDDFFWDLTCHKEGTYTSLHGRAVDGRKDMHADFWLDPHRLSSVVASLEPRCDS